MDLVRHREVHEPALVTTAPRDRELDRIVELRERTDEDVEALPGHEPAEPENERSVGIDAVATPHGRPLLRIERAEALRIDTRRHHDARHRSPRGVGARVGGVLPRREHTRRAAQHAPPEERSARDPAGHRDLGAVRDHHVGRGAQAGSDEPEREHRVEEDHISGHLACERVGAPRDRGCRQQHPAAHALDAEVEPVVQRGRVVMGSGENGRLPGRQALPELRQVRLDAADLGREVVRDEKRGQRRDLPT